MESVVYFDLDGTLIDASDRMYRLFQRLVPQSTLSKDDYWMLKRNGQGHEAILNSLFPDMSFYAFMNDWLCLIESDEFLAMDRLYPDSVSVLECLASYYDLHLLTARQSKTALFRELNALGIIDFFTSLHVTEAVVSKAQLLDDLSNSGTKVKGMSFLSDMGADIRTGNEKGMYTIALTRGFMGPERLRSYHPRAMVNDLIEARDLIMTLRQGSPL